MNMHIHTFGCKLNISESENIKTSLINYGYNFTNIDDANCIIVNTCTVTKESDNKIITYINNIRENGKIDIPIFLIGCYVSKESYVNNDRFIIIIKNDEKDKSHIIINDYLKKHDSKKINNITDDNNKDTTQEKSRFFIKIQDGCNVFCSYCIVAFVRGKVKSIEPSFIIENIYKAVKSGYREIVFTGINIASYNYNGINFASLIKNYIFDILEKNNIRLRLSSIEPFLFTDDVISLFKHKNICSHIHIPLQSASDKILKLMNRRYTKNEYISIIEKLRDINKNIFITTDIMVGFPEENEDDFNETFDLANDIKFSKIHIFRYSKREGTKAYCYQNQIAHRTKIKRAKLLNELNTKMQQYYKNILNEKYLEIIIEKKLNNNQYYGTSSEYMKMKVIDAPDNIKNKMLISGKCFIDNSNNLIVKYEKIK